MAIIPNHTLRLLRADKPALGLGLGILRSVAAPSIAKAAGYDWIFIDMEHGAFSVHEATQLCLAALNTGVSPIVRVCYDALDEGTRVLDNGAQGIVVPHVDTPAQAKRIADAFRYAPDGTRSWGGGIAQHGFLPPPTRQAQTEVNEETAVIVMIETAEAVANADAIAATPGIDALLIGTSDLTLDLGISGQFGHDKVKAAYQTVIDACKKHGKQAGLGGIYDEEWSRFYINMGTKLILVGNDQGLLLQAAIARTKFMRAILA